VGGCDFESADQLPARPARQRPRSGQWKGRSRPTTKSESDCDHKHRFEVASRRRATRPSLARCARMDGEGGPSRLTLRSSTCSTSKGYYDHEYLYVLLVKYEPIVLRTPERSRSILDLRLIVPSGSRRADSAHMRSSVFGSPSAIPSSACGAVYGVVP
jgi:hypothetical protein